MVGRCHFQPFWMGLNPFRSNFFFIFLEPREKIRNIGDFFTNNFTFPKSFPIQPKTDFSPKNRPKKTIFWSLGKIVCKKFSKKSPIFPKKTDIFPWLQKYEKSCFLKGFESIQNGWKWHPPTTKPLIATIIYSANVFYILLLFIYS